MTEWHDNQPIFRQLADKLSAQIAQGLWPEEQPLPSVRTVASDLKINHLTVMKGYQLLVDQGLIEKRRGQGMFVATGAVAALKAQQRDDFLQNQIPQIAETLAQLNMSLDEFVRQLKSHIKGEQ